jgi:hypothetical protein
LDWLDANIPGTLNGCSMSGIPSISLSDPEVYPNPFKEELSIRFNSSVGEDINIMLSDASGRVLKSVKYKSLSVENTIKLEQLSGLSSGLYFIDIQIGESVNRIKITR